MTHRAIRIALILDLGSSFGRGIARGVVQYFSNYPQYKLRFTSMRLIEELSMQVNLDPWHGIIAHINATALGALEGLSELPIINIADRIECPAIPQVTADNFLVGEAAGDYLIKKGFSNFAFCGYQEHNYSLKRLAGLQNRLRKSNLSLASEPLYETQNQPMRLWLSQLPKPIGILACNDACAVKLINNALESGYDVPKEVAILGVDDDSMINQISPIPLSSVIIDTEAIGQQAAAALHEKLENRATGSYPLLIPPLGVASRKSTDVHSKYDPLVNRAMAFIQTNVSTGVRVSDVLSVVNVSRKCLELHFKASGHLSPYREIMLSRLKLAQQLLKQTDFSIEVIAGRCGYEDKSSFTHTFQKQMGMPPSEFRKTCR